VILNISLMPAPIQKNCFPSPACWQQASTADKVKLVLVVSVLALSIIVAVGSFIFLAAQSGVYGTGAANWALSVLPRAVPPVLFVVSLFSTIFSGLLFARLLNRPPPPDGPKPPEVRTHDPVLQMKPPKIEIST